MSCSCNETDNTENGNFYCTGKGGDRLEFQCPQGHVCVEDVNFGPDPDVGTAHRKYCKAAKRCEEEDLTKTCDDIYYFPNPMNTYKVCKSRTSCRSEECCTKQGTFQMMSSRLGKDYTQMCMTETRKSAVEMRPCNARISNQQWKWKGGGLLMNPAVGKCIQAEGDQHYVSLKECNPRSAQQHWRYMGDKPGTLYNHDSDKVLDVKGAETYVADRTGVIIWSDDKARDYTPNLQQRWTFLPHQEEISQTIQEGAALEDDQGGISASLACVSAFAVLAFLIAALAFRSKWSRRQETEHSDELTSEMQA